MVHNGLQAYKRFVAMPILRKFETEVNTFLFMYMNSRDVIICYLELRKTRSVFPIPLEFEISKFACILCFLLKLDENDEYNLYQKKKNNSDLPNIFFGNVTGNTHIPFFA